MNPDILARIDAALGVLDTHPYLNHPVAPSWIKLGTGEARQMQAALLGARAEIVRQAALIPKPPVCQQCGHFEGTCACDCDDAPPTDDEVRNRGRGPITDEERGRVWDEGFYQWWLNRHLAKPDHREDDTYYGVTFPTGNPYVAEAARDAERSNETDAREVPMFAGTRDALDGLTIRGGEKS